MELEEWVNELTARMDARLPRIRELRSYTNGNAPLPEMGANLRKQWEKFQRKSVTNCGGLIVSTLAERIVPNGVLVGDGENDEIMRAARKIWRDNRLDIVFSDVINDVFATGTGYLLTVMGDDDRPLITRERPEVFYALPDPIRSWRARAAIKVWRDSIAKKDHLTLWADNIESSWERSSEYEMKTLTRISGDWKLVSQTYYEGSIPVTILENKDNKSEFEDHTGLIDRINWGILQRLCTTAMQSFKQRALITKEDTPGLPEEDEAGDPIDYQQIFEPGPGALWELPPGVNLWESSTTDIRPMLDATKDDWRELAAVTQLPLSVMLPDSANQSASGAEAPQKQLVSKARDRINRLQPGMSVALVRGLHLLGIDLGEDTLEVIFEPPHAVSMTEKYAAAAQAKAAGESLETIQRNILGYSPEQIAEDKRRRSRERFEMQLDEQAVKGGLGE